MRVYQKYAKITVCVFLTAVFFFIYKYLSDNNTNVIQYVHLKSNETDLKYILLWTSPKTEPFVFIGLERSGFIKRNCSYTNCFVTADRNYFENYGQFHAVVFAMSEATRYKSSQLPKYRSPDQKYVFSSIESSHYYPACSDRFNNYFNWTWSFRLDSDCRYEYMAIRDMHDNVIGPNKIMHWMKVENMTPVSSELKNSLQSKTIAAAWFASNCHSKSKREEFVEQLRNELSKYNHTVDIYGKCGKLSCPRKKTQKCFELIKKKYYFYLSFENSYSVDYVTEKLLTALKNNAVPIVYGEANYTRFMPDGMYLNARTLGPKALAKQIDLLIRNPDKYADYFRWKNHYSYHGRHESPDTDDICAFCKLLNDEDKFRENSVVGNFREWWDSPKFC
ncbi:alpha-(1,3)-fucosyltransferase C-like [Plodia interpunctella]|uniref:alpha-(1,3)-fucosyltransferase C-like n=1 Tax=Plodia interpunctella TaxID=58824 RepID=UPI002368B824|nr:alpha-(1,3)-fucosyltransferase C-like [Plodia interpunctella]XP_053607600.1 alpha-(1,3)-fucosyltransferase C-like [Plodia interpunctella]XP_053607601.1 alpha-(1,3)-fucosyltransferase C-like [Plodia interpunctella]